PIIPLPMPVVVKAVACESLDRGGPDPQIVVDPGRYGFFLGMPDGVAPLVAKAARHVNIPDHALFHFLFRLVERSPGSRAVLHDAIVLARSRNDLLRFEHIVRTRLLDVDVFSRLACPDGLQGVLEVGRGEGNGIDAFVFEQLPHVEDSGRALLARLLHHLASLFQHGFIDIAEGCDLDVRDIQVGLDVSLALSSEPYNGHPDGVVRAGQRACAKRRRQSHRAHQETPSMDVIHGFSFVKAVSPDFACLVWAYCLYSSAILVPGTPGWMISR